MRITTKISIFIALCVVLPAFAQSSSLSIFTADVLVVDEKGVPIEGASVEPVSLSINYPKVKTNKKGKANLGFKIQKIEWVTVSKKGCQKVVQAKYRGLPKPVKITLVKQP